MYQRSSSLTTESMNAANKSVRDQTAVDSINAMLLLLKLEATRYSKNKEKAWTWNEVLTPHGKKLSDNVFSKVNPRSYTITIDAELDKYVCTVSRMTSNYRLDWAKKVSLAAICLVAGSASFGLREN